MVRKICVLAMASVILMFWSGCGGSSQEPRSDEPFFSRMVVTEMRLSADGDRVETVNVPTDGGEDLSLSLSQDIDSIAWSAKHISGHIRLTARPQEVVMRHRDRGEEAS